MEFLVEACPFALGIALGLICQHFGGLRRLPWLWPLACVALGSLATFLSGEWLISPVYFLLDIGLVALVALVTVYTYPLVRRLRAR